VVFYLEILRPHKYSNARSRRTKTGHTYSAYIEIVDSHYQNRYPITSYRSEIFTIDRLGHTNGTYMNRGPAAGQDLRSDEYRGNIDKKEYPGKSSGRLSWSWIRKSSVLNWPYDLVTITGVPAWFP